MISCEQGGVITWLADTSLALLTAVIFFAVYLAAAVVLVVLYLVRRSGHAAALGPLSPGLLSPLGLIFGLLVGFLVADVWSDRAQAATAVGQEASALRDVDLLSSAFPAQQPQIRQLLRDQIDEYVAGEWPRMADGQGTLTLAPALLVQIRGVVLGVPIQSDGQRVAQDRLETSIDRALEAAAPAWR
ncbi:hypothetical protein LWC33_22110 [Pseudonocardia sp. RS11V-5]|uniref:bestrophin-like domain n=1 Tax=Pseudonocardia terrae TaxID=2905831 RepID=UPI001E46D2E9|nr:hypothetical protein [Pseudonocardia terrae]MCE3554133.1 hypothetical protein [Pseudonocardia terrae]